jgi:uncharacterized membrane protein (UPF0127 family)
MSGPVTVTNVSRGHTLGTRIGVADGWWSRLRGLLGRPAPAEGEGLLLLPCRSVHMFGMRGALDVAFVDRDGAVIAAYHALPPGGRTRWHRRAHAALELPPGTLRRTGTHEGDTLTWHAPVQAAA